MSAYLVPMMGRPVDISPGQSPYQLQAGANQIAEQQNQVTAGGLQNQITQRQIAGQRALEQSLKDAFPSPAGSAPTAPPSGPQPPPLATNPSTGQPTLAQPAGPTFAPDPAGGATPATPLGQLNSATAVPGSSPSPSPAPGTGTPLPAAPIPAAAPAGAGTGTPPASAAGTAPSSPDLFGSFDAAIRKLYAGGFAPEAMALQQHVATAGKGWLDYQKAQLDFAASQTERVAQTMSTSTNQTEWDAAKAVLGQLGIPAAAIAHIPAQYDPAWQAQTKQQALTVQQQIDAASKKITDQKNQADAAKANADAAATSAKLPAEIRSGQAAATLAEAKANLTKIPPEQWLSQVDSIVPPGGASASYNGIAKSRIGFAARAGDVDAAKKVLDDAAEYANAPGKAASVAAATAPIDVAKAVATEKATSGLKVAQAVATAKALRQGDLPAIAGVPPGNINQVQGAATKLDMDYVSAKTAADDIANLLQMARGGNVAAGANIPLAGVGAINAVNGIKRINSAEIQQYGTAGSLIQKIQGKLEGWTEGKPIPDSVLDDMASVHQMLSQGAYQKYSDGLNALDLRSGAKYAPAFEAPKPLGAAAAPSYAVGQTVTIKGKPMKITKVSPDGTFDAQ